MAYADSTTPGSTSPGGSSTGADDSGQGSSGTGSTGSGTATTGTGAGSGTTTESATTATGSASTTPSTTTDVSKTSGATSSSIQVAPGVTISANSIKIGSKTITLGLGALKPPPGARPADAKPADAEAQPESEGPSGEMIEVPEGSSSPVASASEAEQKDSALRETESNSTHPVTTKATTTSLATAASALRTSVSVVDDAVKTATRQSATAAETNTATTPQAFTVKTASSAIALPRAAAAVSPVAPSTQVTQIGTGVVGFFNQVVTNLLNPFLAPSPNNTPEPTTPVVWAVLGWVRRNLFNQAPIVAYNPETTVQTGQTVTGNIGATDPENDALTYTITEAPKYGTLTIDQATGDFTYTPKDIDYNSVQTDSFTVSVTDGNKVNLLGLFKPRSDTEKISLAVQPPTVERVILDMPPGVTNPANPRYGDTSYTGAIAGESILFAATWAHSDRTEIFETGVDGTQVECLTCGLAAPTIAASDPSLPVNLRKPVPFYDGSGRVVVLLNNPEPRYAIYEPAGYNGIGSPARIVNVITPDGGGATLPGLPGGILNREREMRPSPDGTHVLFTRIVFGQTGNFQALPIVGELTPNGDHYDVTNAAVVWPTGEGKQWTPDGKGVVIQGGAIEAGNVDDIMVDLSGQTGDNLYPGSPFRGTRVTGNLDYDEDMDFSPNMQWITVGSTRGFEALTPMTRIVRQNFLPVYVGAAIYDQYADGQVRNVSNQNWAVAVEDDLNRENGIPLFVQDDPTTPGVDEGDGWISRSMPSWNPDGTAVTFWESGNGDEHGIAPTQSRLVIANLKYTTSVGPVGDTDDSVQPVGVPSAGHLRRQDDTAAADRNLQRRGRWHRGGQRGPLTRRHSKRPARCSTPITSTRMD